MTDDPYRNAFKARQAKVISSIDTDAGLVELGQRRTAAERRRAFSVTAAVLLVLGGVGLGLGDRLSDRADPTELATSGVADSGSGTGQSPTSNGQPLSTPSPPLTAEEVTTSTTSISTSTTTTEPPSTTTTTSAPSMPGPPTMPVPIIATGSSLSEFPCVLDNETLVAASNLATNGPYDVPLGPTPGTGVVAVTRETNDRCQRFVITLDGPGFAQGTTASGTPTGVLVELPGVTLAALVELAEGVTFVLPQVETDNPAIEIVVEPGATIVSYGDSPARVVIDHRSDRG